MGGQPRRSLGLHHQNTWTERGLGWAQKVGQVAGAAHTAYQIGKGLYEVGKLAAPLLGIL
jgi:hypothetical protein